MSRYPSKIETLVISEQIVSGMDIVGDKRIIHEVHDKKLYVIHWDRIQIISCLVFDFNDNLIDYYDNCELLYNEIHEQKTYLQWIDYV